MTTVPNTTDPGVEVRLERIQAAVDVGNAETKGALALMLLRSDQSEKVADQRAAQLAVELRERDARLAVELKERDDRMDKNDKRFEALVEKGDQRHAALESKVQGLAKQVWILVGGAGTLGASAAAVVQVLMKH